MLLKGMYSTTVDRMKINDYKTHMFHKFGVMIEEDLPSIKIQGFIIKDVWYRLWIPYIGQDGKPESFKKEGMEYIGIYQGSVFLKMRIKELIKEDPERFAQMYRGMKLLEKEAEERRYKYDERRS